MARNANSITVLLILTTAWLAGCGGGEPPRPTPVAPPAETLAALAKATRSGDADAFLACFHATGEQTDMLKTLMNVNQAAYELREAVVAAHGEDAWAKLTDWMAHRALATFQADDPKWLAAADLRHDARSASFSVDGLARRVRMLREDGAWKIRADDLLGGEQMRPKLVATLGKLVQVYRDAAARAADANVTMAVLTDELRRGTMQAGDVGLPTRPAPPPPLPVPAPTQPTSPATPPLPDSRPDEDGDIVG